MKLKSVMFGLILSAFSCSYAVLVTMPSQKLLDQRLHRAGMGHFAQKTRIAKLLANKTVDPAAVGVAVDVSILMYLARSSGTNPVHTIQGKKVVLAALLSGLPQSKL